MPQICWYPPDSRGCVGAVERDSMQSDSVVCGSILHLCSTAKSCETRPPGSARVRGAGAAWPSVVRIVRYTPPDTTLQLLIFAPARTAYLELINARGLGVKRGESVRLGMAVISRQCVPSLHSTRTMSCPDVRASQLRPRVRPMQSATSSPYSTASPDG